MSLGWLWIVAGIVALVWLWVRQTREHARLSNGYVSGTDPKTDKKILDNRLTAVLLTPIILFAMWGWGFLSIQTQQEQDKMERMWFANYVANHKVDWDDTCDLIFDFDFNNGEDLYANGQVYTVDWCKGEWSPPAVPAEYSSSDYDQPWAAKPYPQDVVFADGHPRLCPSNDPDDDFCFDWFDISDRYMDRSEDYFP